MKAITTREGTICRLMLSRRLVAFWSLGLFRLLFLFSLPVAVEAQFNYTNENGQITITGYTGPGGAFVIPSTIDGLPVIRIGNGAFSGNASLTNVTIPESVIDIGDSAFRFCTNLTNVNIGNSVSSIGSEAFGGCWNLTSVAIPNSVTGIGGYAFSWCGLTNVTIGSSVTNIGHGAFLLCTVLMSISIPDSVINIDHIAFHGCNSLTKVTIGNNVRSIGGAVFHDCTSLASVVIGGSLTHIGFDTFGGCSSLRGVCFQGNAPSDDGFLFDRAYNATVYYLPGTTGWGPTFAGRPTVLWNPHVQSSDSSFGVHAGQFGFIITGISGLTIVVEASADLADLVWTPVSTNTLTGGLSEFSDSQWTNHPTRLYRLSPP